MPEILMRSYRTEYETTSITMSEIIQKYNIPDTQDLSDWHKRPKSILIPELVDTEEGTTEEPGTDLDTIGYDKEKILKDINSFKEEVVKYANDAIKTDADHLEVKEVKDLVAMVNTVETSIKGTKDTGPTINILVQNLVEKYKDDC